MREVDHALGIGDHGLRTVQDERGVLLLHRRDGLPRASPRALPHGPQRERQHGDPTGVMRSTHLKNGIRIDAGLWSRLPSDP
ncbi:MAG: hypothetical protein JWR63_2734 [Conexibacter sp.]|nr:hypothetical protein [Conexibacter sp.]